ncbi:GAF domain-containing protein [Myxococcota bacterium]|nr:GAF domain-containing protein [Myxococcota bacterium]MBU1382983.1 GAF domain-containing protein [Myxococcota bacterium]MBU1499180.1 GAF domain-containing protein [Myxococcota bacterium]
MAKLIIATSNPPVEHDLKDYTTIGRMPRNTIQILDRILSKVHAQIVKLKDGRYLIKDLGSLNGTYIRGQRITEYILEDGEEIAMGSTLLRFVSSADQKPAKDVEISPDGVASQIHQTIQAEGAENFPPESAITDVNVVRRDYERLRISHEVATYLGVQTDLNTLLAKILTKIFEIFACDRGIIFLPAGDGKMRPIVSRFRNQDDEEDGNIVVSQTILSNVVNNKEAVLSSDASMDSRFNTAKSIIIQGIRSTMSVPMIYGEKLLGVIYLDSQMATGAFSKKDLQLLTGIAAQAAMAINNTNLIKQIESDTKTRAQFEKLLSPNLVDQIVEGKLTFDQEGQLSEVTTLFADIRGFTSMSENMEAKEIVKMLNTYFEVMVDVIFTYQGTLDKFVGDEIMALFGAPVTMPGSARMAVECSLEMIASLEVYNTARIAEGKKPIAIGIGINTGEVVSGALGSSKTLQYTVVGDPVNLAARLCSLAKPMEIIIGENTYNQVKDYFDFENREPVSVKGKAKPVNIFAVLGMKARKENTITYTKPQ